MYAPQSLNVTVTLTFDLRFPKFNRDRLLVLTNHHIKLEDPWAMSSLVIDQTRFVYGWTDGWTDGPTCAKQYTPSSSKGGIIIIITNNNFHE